MSIVIYNMCPKCRRVTTPKVSRGWQFEVDDDGRPVGMPYAGIECTRCNHAICDDGKAGINATPNELLEDIAEQWNEESLKHWTNANDGVFIMSFKGVEDYGSLIDPSQLTHTTPETQERIDDDATMPPRRYYAEKIGHDVGLKDDEEVFTAVALSLLRRQRELDARTMGGE